MKSDLSNEIAKIEAKPAIQAKSGVRQIGVKEPQAPLDGYGRMSSLSPHTIGRLLATTSAVAFLSIASPAVALQATENPWFGRVLTDDVGVSVYVVEDDRDCIDECRLLWTPVPADAVAASDPDLEPQLIGSMRGPNGIFQTTYAGRPLFYFAEDFVPGDVNGHQFDEFGHVSYLIDPSGTVLDAAFGDECECHLDEIAQY